MFTSTIRASRPQSEPRFTCLPDLVWWSRATAAQQAAIRADLEACRKDGIAHSEYLACLAEFDDAGAFLAAAGITADGPCTNVFPDVRPVEVTPPARK